MKLSPVEMEFTYEEAFRSIEQPADYERLLLDAIRGDQTLFARTDGIEASWALVMNLLAKPPPLTPYSRGSWGPREADQLIENDNRRWFLDEDSV